MRLKSRFLSLWKWKLEKDKKEGGWQQRDQDSTSRCADRAAAERHHYHITGIDCNSDSYCLPTQVHGWEQWGCCFRPRNRPTGRVRSQHSAWTWCRPCPAGPGLAGGGVHNIFKLYRCFQSIYIYIAILYSYIICSVPNYNLSNSVASCILQVIFF